jgi:hypothetical protein
VKGLTEHIGRSTRPLSATHGRQHMTRLLTLRYRADLRTLRAREIHHQLGGVGFFSTSSSAAATATREEPLLDEEADRTAAELLDLLKTIPLQVLGEQPMF